MRLSGLWGYKIQREALSAFTDRSSNGVRYTDTNRRCGCSHGNLGLKEGRPQLSLGIQPAFQEGALDSGIHAEVSACAKARPQGEADVFGKEQRSERGRVRGLSH